MGSVFKPTLRARLNRKAEALVALGMARKWPVFRLFGDKGPQPDPVQLNQSSIFILPTRHGLLFGLALAAMLLGSINYSNNLGFVLTFLLGSLATVSILHTYRNLDKLIFAPGNTRPVFAGQSASFQVHVANREIRSRCALLVESPHTQARYVDVPAMDSACLFFTVPTRQRGILKASKFVLSTRFPLGLFRAWSKIELDMSCLVYPAPDAIAAPLVSVASETGSGLYCPDSGTEDFSGFRGYHPGDSARHIAWKAAARELGLLTKQFTAQASSTLWLDWDALPGMETEARLSRLCRWALDAEQSGRSYGLRLPGATIPLGKGEAQRHRCLKALALFALDIQRP